MTLPCRRHLFDLPEEVTYLKTADQGPVPRQVLEAGNRGRGCKSRPWSIRFPDYFKPAEEARELLARLIGGDAEGVSLTRR